MRIPLAACAQYRDDARTFGVSHRPYGPAQAVSTRSTWRPGVEAMSAVKELIETPRYPGSGLQNTPVCTK